MRAWLEEKREELMLPVKLSGYPPTKWHIERNEIIDSILAELELKMTEGERRETLNYFQDIMSSFVNYKTEWNSPKCRKIRDLITGKEAAMEPDITIKEKKNCLINWRERLIEMNDDSDSRDYWSEEQYGDQSMFDSILAALEVKVTRAEIEKFVEGSLCRAMDSKKMADAVQCFLRSIELVALAERPESVTEANRGRDKLWCEALVHELDTRDVEKVTRYFNFIRPIKETTDAD